MVADEIKTRLLKAFPSCEIVLKDLTGGEDHWQLDIKCTEFSGKSLVEQHQMVYKALGDMMGHSSQIHALALNTSIL